MSELDELSVVYLGLGSNLGDKVATVRAAARRFAELPCIQNVELSPLYRTAPIGETDQDWFVNAVVRLQTSLEPKTLLNRCLDLETTFLRQRSRRWGPRTLDIDILLFGELEVDEPGLRIPHPRARERAFVLAPLRDLQADLSLSGVVVSELLARCSDQEIERLEVGDRL